MITLRMIKTGAIVTVTNNVAFDLLDRGLAIQVETEEVYKPKEYLHRQMRVKNRK